MLVWWRQNYSWCVIRVSSRRDGVCHFVYGDSGHQLWENLKLNVVFVLEDLLELEVASHVGAIFAVSKTVDLVTIELERLRSVFHDLYETWWRRMLGRIGEPQRGRQESKHHQLLIH